MPCHWHSQQPSPHILSTKGSQHHGCMTHMGDTPLFGVAFMWGAGGLTAHPWHPLGGNKVDRGTCCWRPGCGRPGQQAQQGRKVNHAAAAGGPGITAGHHMIWRAQLPCSVHKGFGAHSLSTAGCQLGSLLSSMCSDQVLHCVGFTLLPLHAFPPVAACTCGSGYGVCSLPRPT
jgi:hypothetical protein